jgi:hypothetical protein
MSRPLIYLLIALIVGIIAGSYFTPPLNLLLSAVILNLLFLLIIIRNHGGETAKHALKTDSAALRPACSRSYFRNWSFTNKWLIAWFFLTLSFIFLLGALNIQKQNYFIKDERNIGQCIDKGKVSMEGVVIESPLAYRMS